MSSASNKISPGRFVTSGDLLLAALLAAGAIGIMSDAWIDIVRLGLRQEELSYVFLAPIVIGWIAIARRKQLVNCPLRHQWAGLVILAAGWLAFWYGYLADPVLWRAGAVMVAVGAVVSMLGLNTLLRMWPAFAATIFLVPISPNGRYQLAVPLQNATAQLTQTVCDLLGIYVTRSGNLLSINGVDVTVAEACNGMRMIITLIMVCYTVAFISAMPAYARLMMLLLSPGVAILANVARLVPTVWMFGHTSIERAEYFHSAAGWVMTVLAFLFLMGCTRLVRWAMQPSSRLTPQPA
jgi:exosortase